MSFVKKMLAMLAIACVGMFLVADVANAQCGANGTGQCGAPASSLSAAQQLTQLQFQNGLTANTGAAASASTAVAAPAAQFVAPAQQFAVQSYGYVNPAQVYLVMPSLAQAQVAAVEAAPVAPVIPTAPQQAVSLFQLAAFPQAVAGGGGASAAASATTAAPAAALAPAPVVIPSAAATVGCSSCGGRARLLPRLLPRSRAVSRSRSVSRT